MLEVEKAIARLFNALDDTLVPAAGELGFLSSADPGQVYARIQAQFGF